MAAAGPFSDGVTIKHTPSSPSGPSWHGVMDGGQMHAYVPLGADEYKKRVRVWNSTAQRYESSSPSVEVYYYTPPNTYQVKQGGVVIEQGQWVAVA